MMAGFRYPEWNNPAEDAIRRLKSDLYEARTTIIELMPEDIQRLLTSYYSCESRQQTYGWAESVADEIVESAEVLPRQQGFYFSDRAYCPLCGHGSESPYESGFAVPEGLRRHLVGWGNTRQCRVMEAALYLAGDYWHDKFHAAEQAEEAPSVNAWRRASGLRRSIARRRMTILGWLTKESVTARQQETRPSLPGRKAA
jgi:hypothetical protein